MRTKSLKIMARRSDTFVGNRLEQIRLDRKQTGSCLRSRNQRQHYRIVWSTNYEVKPWRPILLNTQGRTTQPHNTEARAAPNPDNLGAKPAPKALQIPKENLDQRLEMPADKTLMLLWTNRGHIESILPYHNHPIRRRIRISQVGG